MCVQGDSSSSRWWVQLWMGSAKKINVIERTRGGAQLIFFAAGFDCPGSLIELAMTMVHWQREETVDKKKKNASLVKWQDKTLPLKQCNKSPKVYS